MQAKRSSYAAFFCLTILVSIADSAENKPESWKALLVGCTKYDFNERRNLLGPANDVALMNDLLVNHFGFLARRIRCLVDGQSPEERPTRANIIREIATLIHDAERGQRIVLFFAGHGSQQPDQLPPNPDDPEPDGLDEVFLPCDIGPWNSEIQSIKNAIVDDEIRVWMGKLLAKGAELVVIFDSCYSGSACRGGDDEVSRRIDAEDLVPKEALSAAAARAVGTRGGKLPADQRTFDPLAGGKWVALYAALPEQPTVELSLPRNSSASRKQGLFTYTLCEALRQSTTFSYSELVQRIRGAYLAQGRYTPTPLIEGTNQDRGVLGGERAATSILLEKDAEGHWLVRAGELDGCTKGSILAVRALGAKTDSPPVGYVQVTDAGLSKSQVQPCAYEGQPAKEGLPVGGLCRLVYVDYGDQSLRVAIDGATTRGNSTDPVRAVVNQLAGEKNSPIKIVDEIAKADWLVIERTKAGQPSDWVLSPRSEVIETRGLNRPSAQPQIQFAIDPKAPDKMMATFQSIRRAQKLLGLSARFGNESSDECNIECEVSYKGAGAATAVKMTVDQPTTIRAGGKIQIKVHNRGRHAMDFNLLFVDSMFGIQPIFPRSYASDNRLASGRSYETKPLSVTATTVGRENIVLIAFPAEGGPTNLMHLAQPTLELARKESGRRRGDEAAQPFEQFLEFIAYGAGSARGLSIGVAKPVVQVRSWIVEP
jgi:hypothetical protein